MPKLLAGFTLIELILVMGMLFVVLAATIVAVDPVGRKQQAQDVKRLDYLLQLSAAIEEYRVDNGSYPGADSVMYSSNAINAGRWIDDDLSEYIPIQVVDPVNDVTYHFRYQRVGDGYELDSAFEALEDDAQDDAGNNSQRYEIGTNLEILD